MPVDTEHPEYIAHESMWRRARIAYQGSDAVKTASTEFLPMLSAMDSDEYQIYLRGAVWYGAPERTINGLTGAVLRKPLEITLPDRVEFLEDDFTMTGVRFEKFAHSVLIEVMKVGRTGVLVDMPPDADGEDMRPYATQYLTEDIVNWRTRRMGGREVTTMVVLREQFFQPDPDDIFAVDLKTQYRELFLDDEGGRIVYRQRVWLERDNASKEGERYVLADEITPQMRGVPLDYVPFIIFNTEDLAPNPRKPPLMDMIDVNYQMYVNSADYERALHFCGSPVYFFSGIDREQEIAIGPSRAIISDREGATGSILQGSAESVSALQFAMSEKKADVAKLGSRLLEEQKSGVEAADAIRLRFAGEQAVMRSMAGAFGEGLNLTMRIMARWMGASEDGINISVNRDFVYVALSPAQIQSYMGLHQAGHISYATLYDLLASGELTRNGVDWTEEREQIDSEQESDLASARALTQLVSGATEEDNSFGR